MRRFRILAVAAGLMSLLALIRSADAVEGLRARVAARQAAPSVWHGYNYDPAWGMPVALVVPPTAKYQTHYGWGVGNTRVTTIDNQFSAGWPGPGVYDRRFFHATPPWPSDTDQFGVHYVRGPW